MLKGEISGVSGSINFGGFNSIGSGSAISICCSETLIFGGSMLKGEISVSGSMILSGVLILENTFSRLPFISSVTFSEVSLTPATIPGRINFPISSRITFEGECIPRISLKPVTQLSLKSPRYSSRLKSTSSSPEHIPSRIFFPSSAQSISESAVDISSKRFSEKSLNLLARSHNPSIIFTSMSTPVVISFLMLSGFNSSLMISSIIWNAASINLSRLSTIPSEIAISISIAASSIFCRLSFFRSSSIRNCIT